MPRREHNPNGPHQATILIKAEIMERLQDGRMSGIPVSKDSKLFTVFGDTFEDCQENVQKKVQEITEVFKDG